MNRVICQFHEEEIRIDFQLNILKKIEESSNKISNYAKNR